MRHSRALSIALAVRAISPAAYSDDYEKLIDQAVLLTQKNESLKAVTLFEQAFNGLADPDPWGRTVSYDFYHGAQSAILANRKDLALDWLRKAVDLGLPAPDLVQNDPALAPLHGEPGWDVMLRKVRENLRARNAAVDEPLRAELELVYDCDQKYRVEVERVEKTYGRQSPQRAELFQAMERTDAENLTKVKGILLKRGWLGPEVVGYKGNEALFLVIQHADLATQKAFVSLMRDAVVKKKARATDFALLEDRIAIREGRGQIYGSQILFSEAKKRYYIARLQDPKNVDVRRSAIGLQPIAEYAKQWNISWNPSDYEEELLSIERDVRSVK